MRGPGHVFTRDELLELVWDDASESLDRTVDAHVKTLRAKLKAVAPTLEPIRTHRGAGYALAEDLPARCRRERPHGRCRHERALGRSGGGARQCEARGS